MDLRIRYADLLEDGDGAPIRETIRDLADAYPALEPPPGLVASLDGVIRRAASSSCTDSCQRARPPGWRRFVPSWLEYSRPRHALAPLVIAVLAVSVLGGATMAATHVIRTVSLGEPVTRDISRGGEPPFTAPLFLHQPRVRCRATNARTPAIENGLPIAYHPSGRRASRIMSVPRSYHPRSSQSPIPASSPCVRRCIARATGIAPWWASGIPHQEWRGRSSSSLSIPSGSRTGAGPGSQAGPCGRSG